jgi:hypothetical protein
MKALGIAGLLALSVIFTSCDGDAGKKSAVVIRSAPQVETDPPTTSEPSTTVTTTTGQVSSASCHPSYTRTCIPPDGSDADCAGGGGNGPWYVKEKNIGVIGPDVFDLDRDGDGIGCES